MPHGTLEVVLTSAKGLENTDFLCKLFSLSTFLKCIFLFVNTHFRLFDGPVTNYMKILIIVIANGTDLFI